MPIARAGKGRLFRTSRYDRGKGSYGENLCGICHKEILHGQGYGYAGGTNTENQHIVHFNCIQPSNAPTWEELQKSKSEPSA
jgi:hypothetical protein